MISALLTSALIFSSCSEDNATDLEIKDFNSTYYRWVDEYERKKTVASWNIYKDTTRNIIEKKKIVRILRMASSSVMNSPALYNKYYSGNLITEKGSGAENEDFIIFYLSDGKIIKASPKVNPEWMGAMVGEKVLKTTGKQLTAEIEKKVNIEPNAKYCGAYNFLHFMDTLEAATDFHFEEYVTYSPLYSK